MILAGDREAKDQAVSLQQSAWIVQVSVQHITESNCNDNTCNPYD